MASWEELALDSRAAAQSLQDQGRFRSSVSRSYYAVYSAVVHRLSSQGLSYAYGRRNPPHEAVPQYVLANLTHLGPRVQREVAKTYRLLMKARVDADYRPGLTCDRETARDALRACYQILMVGVLE